MRRLLALGVTAAITGSTLNLLMIRYLRDYAKAPFILAGMFLMACLVTRASTRGQVLGLAAAGGLVVGLGLGFRNDLLLLIAPFVFTLAFLLPPAIAPAMTRAAACLTFITTFAIAALPVLADYSGGSNTGHVTVLGLTDPFDRDLGVSPPLYDYGHFYLDTLAHAIVATYADRTQPRPGGITYLSPEYDRAAVSYLLDIAKRCPADLIVRSYAAITTLPGYFLDQYQYAPTSNAAFKVLYRIRAFGNAKLRPLAPWLVALAVCLVAVASLRWAALMVVVLLFLMGATAIQFQPRHFFYYEVVSWWSIGFIAEVCLLAARRSTRAALPLQGARIARGLVFTAAVAIAMWGVLQAARIYQTRQVIRMFEALDAAPKDRWALTPRASSSGRVLLTAVDRPRPLSSRSGGFTYQYVMVQVDPAECGAQTAPVRAVYDARTPDVDLSQDLTLRPHVPAARPVRFFYPVYERGDDIRFAGFEVDARAASCVAAYQITNASAYPLLLTAQLFDGWQNATLYQTLGWERRIP
jgi:hypothetical protein